MAEPQPPKLLDQVRQRLRVKHYSIRTEDAYVGWIRRYILFHGKRRPKEMGENEISAFLTHLAVEGKVSASTQNQALCALLFLYGSDPRLMECPGLRVKDPDFEYKQVIVRDGKGEKDRPTLLPETIIEPLRNHLAKAKLIHEQDLKEGYGNAYPPYALARKYPNAGGEWGWQYVFPAAYRSEDPRSAEIRRHHAGEEALRRAVRKAVRKAGIVKPGTCHTLRQFCNPPPEGRI
jgi:integrase